MTDYYKSSAEETLRELQTSQTGLTYRQAQAKRSKELQNYAFLRNISESISAFFLSASSTI